MQLVLPSQAYTLKIAPHPAPFSILKFKGLDRVSELYWYDIEFTSPQAGIPMDQVLGRPARFTILKGNVTVNDPGGGRFKFPSWPHTSLGEVKNVINGGFSK